VRIESFSGADVPFVNAPPLALETPVSGPSVAARNLSNPTILVFDSGVGGLTVFREVSKARPDAHYIYAADDALFPYGAVEETRLVARVTDLMRGFIERYQPDLVVIACNTASTIVLPALRQTFTVPFVGTVPAIKPACAASETKRVSVLGTEATVRREYTQALIQQFAAGCHVKLVGSAQLAGYAERELKGEPVSDADLAAAMAPAYVNDGIARTDTIVLACTHYPLLMRRMIAVAPWPVSFVDPAPAVARRVVSLIGPATALAEVDAQAVFTSGKRLSPELENALAGFGLQSSVAA
jgi:glutamate racemase